jgi:hypothetical protein
MSLSENDLEKLEEYLDGALADAESRQLQLRISRDPEWNAALEQLRAQRTMRQQFFAELQPDQAAVDRVLDGVRTSANRREVWQKQSRYLRFAAAAAACLLLGIFLGHRINFAPTSNGPTQETVATVPAPTAATPKFYDVELTDAAGKVVAVQRFDSLEKASEFANDIRRTQQSSQGGTADHVLNASVEKF